MPEIEFTDEPRNTEGLPFLGVDIDSINVDQWHPMPDGKGRPTQVHLSFEIDGVDVPIVMRFKGPKTLDALIGALAVHRYDVWPENRKAR